MKEKERGGWGERGVVQRAKWYKCPSRPGLFERKAKENDTASSTFVRSSTQTKRASSKLS